MSAEVEVFDFIVVGSGAGGGPLAANLAKLGHQVLLLEAGSATDNLHYQVPAFHALASEDTDLRWNYFVQHYKDRERQRRDPKYTEAEDGVLYPRASTLGGCTAHNAMITLAPHDSDWDGIAAATGDKSWSAKNMQQYFGRLECCTYVLAPGKRPRGALANVLHTLRNVRLFGRQKANPSGHGFDGWLRTSLADPEIALPDKKLLRVIWKGVSRAVARGIELGPIELVKSFLWRGVQHFDPNDLRERLSPEGICFTPLATDNGKRNGTREYIQAVAKAEHQRLSVRTECLVTRVLLDDARPPRAYGVEYLEGRNLYRASAEPHGKTAPPRQVRARHDVVLSAGAFNSPQLLMLSGIGPRDQLEKHHIAVKVDLPGVGHNLQDRYEVGVISEMRENFAILANASFTPPVGEPREAVFAEWQDHGRGLYSSNGAVLGVMMRSTRRATDPDLFVFGLPGGFKGYFPGYAKQLLDKRNRFTWAVLKAHTENRGGQVMLRSPDPCDMPEILFRYFEEGTDTAAEDLEAVVEGVQFARSIMHAAGRAVKKELRPGSEVETREQIREFIRNEAWGHHASCSNKMGPRSDPWAVVDSRFRVHGVHGLRVVDASVFPRIPGFFIVTAIYMISEKATDVLDRDVELKLT